MQFQLIYLKVDIPCFSSFYTISAIQIQKVLKWTGIIVGLSGIILASVLLIVVKQSGSQTPPPTSGTKNEA